jgi:acetyl esterase/lipase
MKTAKLFLLSTVLCVILFSTTSFNNDNIKYERDVVYGYRDGMALVMDVFSPEAGSNNAGIILVMAGGMTSSPLWSHDAGNRADVQNLLNAGYTVFATAHRSQPKYTADESRTDIPRAVRFIRYNSEKFGINPSRIGILGYSSGGHVSLMTATAPFPEDIESDDPIEHESSKVQAVVVYYPSTDLLNFGQMNTTILEHFHSIGYNLDAAFDFHRWNNESNRFERIDDPDTIVDYYKKNSPINFVSNDDPPILIIHGSDDRLVPIQQSKIMIEKLKDHGVSSKLLVMPGKGHGWDSPLDHEYQEVVEWYNQFLH